MRFPDPNIGYLFGYGSTVTETGILITFLGGLVKIPIPFENIESVRRETYTGGRISWDVVRWGKCPTGTAALRVVLKKGALRENLIVFDDLDATIRALESHGVVIG